MLSLIVDEGYAYDYLAILIVKKAEEAYALTSLYLEAQVGKDLHNEIIDSKEFKELIAANIMTFNAVEKAKTDEMTASEVQGCNYLRFKSKTELHKKYFPEKKVTEVKT